LVVSFASPLLRFSMIYNILNLLLLLGFCLFCSVLVFVINFVLGFAVQLVSISTKLLRKPTSARNWFYQKTAIFYMYCFTSITYLATLDVISFVLGLQSNFRPAALQSAYRLIPNTTYFDYTTSQLQQLHGSFLGGEHLASAY
jgi:hypothetical protein